MKIKKTNKKTKKRNKPTEITVTIIRSNTSSSFDEPVWNNHSRIMAAREHSALEKKKAAKLAEYHKKRELLGKLENELALCKNKNLDPIAVLKECRDMIFNVLNGGFVDGSDLYADGLEILKKAAQVILKKL